MCIRDRTRAALRAMVAKQAPYENLPATMYFAANSTTPVYLTSLYEPAPATAPANSVSISWVGTGVNTTLSDVFAIGFRPGKSELLPLPTSLLDVNPNLKQDYGY